MIDKASLVLGLFATGGIGVAWSLIKAKKPSAISSQPSVNPSETPNSSVFGSDDPPPDRTVDFNQMIVDACGASLTDGQKLSMLLSPGISRAEALSKARGILEQSLKGSPAP